jgi:enoyl-CoA hydratase/carnithine racemase
MSQSTEGSVTPYEELVLVDDRGDYAILTIHRPEKRNAMSMDTMKRLREALVEVADKKVVVLTGTGPSFCAGVDISREHAALMDEYAVSHGTQTLHPWTQVQVDIRSHRAVFIAAVNGYALGGGSTLINTCELAIAAESAQIAMPEQSFGSWPMQAGPAAIKRIAPKHAAELIFTARRIDAQTAFRMALVNKVVPDAELLDEAIALAEHIAGFNAYSLDASKHAYHRVQSMTWEEAQDYSSLIVADIRTHGAGPEGAAKSLAGERGPGQGR